MPVAHAWWRLWVWKPVKKPFQVWKRLLWDLGDVESDKIVSNRAPPPLSRSPLNLKSAPVGISECFNCCLCKLRVSVERRLLPQTLLKLHEHFEKPCPGHFLVTGLLSTMGWRIWGEPDATKELHRVRRVTNLFCSFRPWNKLTRDNWYRNLRGFFCIIVEGSAHCLKTGSRQKSATYQGSGKQTRWLKFNST